MSAPRVLWPLALVPAKRFGRTRYALFVFAGLLALYAVAGIFDARPSRAAPPSVAVFFAVILAYIVPALHYLVASAREALDDLAPHLAVPTQTVAEWRDSIGRRTVRRQICIALLGLFAGLAHNVALAGEDGVLTVLRASAADAVVVASTQLVWLVMTAAIAELIDVARLFARIAAFVHVDLLQPRSLTPFARIAVTSTLAIIGAQAAFPIMWVNRDISWLATLPGLVASGVPMLFLFAMPIVPVHRAIAAAKRAELARLDQDVARLGGHADVRGPALDRLVPLLAYRREIEAAREWPFDTSVTGRLVFYLVIPPFTWVAAALIERIVDVAL